MRSVYQYDDGERSEADDVRVFCEVSSDFVKGYSRLTQAGLPAKSIAAAMLGAAVNFYEIFEMSAGLPDTLRALADHLEEDRNIA